MSVARYDFRNRGDDSDMEKCYDGEFVSYGDYEKLEKEIALRRESERLFVEKVVPELKEELEGLKIDLETEQDEVELKQACIKGMSAQADKLAEQIELLKDVIRVDDERLRKAGDSVGIDVGCDTAHWMADEILGLRKKLDEAAKAIEHSRCCDYPEEVRFRCGECSKIDKFLATLKGEAK